MNTQRLPDLHNTHPSHTLNDLWHGERMHDGLINDWVIYVLVSTITAIYGRSQIKVQTDERTQVHSAQSSLAVTHPSTNWARRYLSPVLQMGGNTLRALFAV